MGALIQAVDGHQMAVEQDTAEEQQRIAREMMIKEQDMAYQESLAQDKQKVCGVIYGTSSVMSDSECAWIMHS